MVAEDHMHELSHCQEALKHFVGSEVGREGESGVGRSDSYSMLVWDIPLGPPPALKRYSRFDTIAGERSRFMGLAFKPLIVVDWGTEPQCVLWTRAKDGSTNIMYNSFSSAGSSLPISRYSNLHIIPNCIPTPRVFFFPWIGPTG